MTLSFFDIQKLIELEQQTPALELTTQEILDNLNGIDERTLKLGILLSIHYPDATEADVKSTMEAQEMKYKSIEMDLEKLSATKFIDLDSKPDWQEFFKLFLIDYKENDYISYYEGGVHLLNFMNGLRA